MRYISLRVNCDVYIYLQFLGYIDSANVTIIDLIAIPFDVLALLKNASWFSFWSISKCLHTRSLPPAPAFSPIHLAAGGWRLRQRHFDEACVQRGAQVVLAERGAMPQAKPLHEF